MGDDEDGGNEKESTEITGNGTTGDDA